MNKADSRRTAFTLIEVMLVVAILVMLAGVGILGYGGIQDRARRNVAKTLVDQAASAVEMYELDMKQWPSEDEGLRALVTRPTDDRLAEMWSGPYLRDGVIPVDPWGNELRYARLTATGDGIGPRFHVFSYGPDGQEGTDDDISSAPAAARRR